MVENTIIGETATNEMLQTPINVSYQTYLYIDNAKKPIDGRNSISKLEM